MKEGLFMLKWRIKKCEGVIYLLSINCVSYGWRVVYDPSTCAKTLEVLRQSYRNYRELQNISNVLSDPKRYGIQLTRRLLNKTYWEAMNKKDHFLAQIMRENEGNDNYYERHNSSIYKRNKIHNETFRNCNEVLEVTGDYRDELHQKQLMILQEMESCTDSVSVQKKQSELIAIQSELNSLQATENASINRVVMQNFENANRRDAEGKAEDEALLEADRQRRDLLKGKLENIYLRERYKCKL